MDIFVYNTNKQKVTIIDYAESIIFTTKLAEIGDFELKIPIINKNDLNNIKLGYMVKTTQAKSKFFIIKEIESVLDNENGNYIYFRGEELKTLLTQRIIVGQKIYNDTITNNCLELKNYIDTYYPYNQELYFYANLNNDNTAYDFQFDFETFYNALKTMCDRINCYFDLVFPPEGYEAQFLQLRIFEPTSTPNIVFAQSFNNVLSFSQKMDNYEFCNAACVVGEGNGTAKRYQTVTTGETDKNIIFYNKVDATEISSNSGVVTQAQYNNFLKNQGEAYINSTAIKKVYDMQINTKMYKYLDDFKVSDVVKIINPFDNTILNAIITEVTEKWDESGYLCEPKLEILNS